MTFIYLLRVLRKDNALLADFINTAVGSCYDNAAAESFFGVLKRERVNRRHYQTRAEARADIFDYIEGLHNKRKKRKLGKTDQLALN